MAIGVKRERLRFTDGLIDYLQEVDYQLAISEEEKEKIYKFRYFSYLREKTIDTNAQRRFVDDYDRMDNCWIFGLDYSDQLASSMRIHVVTRETFKSPSLDVFPDIVGPLLESGHKIIDPTRFVADSSTTNFFPVLPFLTFRLACMAADYFNADYCLIPVSSVHVSFYQRIFGLAPIGEPRHYPKLKVPICLMCANVAELWDELIEQYPVFRSTFTERRMLFDKPLPIVQQPDDQDLPIDGEPDDIRLN